MTDKGLKFKSQAVHRLRVCAADRALEQASAQEKHLKFDESSFRFEPGFLPQFRQVYYQLCDIDLPEAVDTLSDLSYSPTPHPQHGWCRAEQLESIREAIKRDVLVMLDALKSENEAAELQQPIQMDVD